MEYIGIIYVVESRLTPYCHPPLTTARKDNMPRPKDLDPHIAVEMVRRAIKQPHTLIFDERSPYALVWHPAHLGFLWVEVTAEEAKTHAPKNGDRMESN